MYSVEVTLESKSISAGAGIIKDGFKKPRLKYIFLMASKLTVGLICGV